MAQGAYYIEGKRFYEVWTSKRRPEGGRVRRRTKFDGNGRRISSKVMADRIEYEIKKDVEQTLSKVNQWTWGRWHEQCLRLMKMSLHESTVVNYDGLVKKWLPFSWGDRLIFEITKSDVYDMIFEHIPQIEFATANIQKGVLRRIKRIFQMAVEEGIINRNPAVGIKVKSAKAEQKVLNSNEAGLLLKMAKECAHRFYYHWALALFTGMRNGELYALRWTSIDLQRGLISVTRQWTLKDGVHQTKSNCNRVVPISPELKKLLIELKRIGPFEETLWVGANNIKKESRDKKEQLFTDLALPRSNEWRQKKQAKALGEFCEGIGIPKVKFHDLRATFITNLLSEGVSLAKVMAIVGHSEVSTTNEYLRLAGVDVKEGTTEKLKYRLHSPFAGNVVQFQ